MKKYLLILSFISIISNQQFAQRRSAEEQAAYLKDLLTLADSQFVFVDSVLKNAQSQILAMRDSGEMDRDKMMEIRNGANSAIETILNDDQKKLYRQYLEERRQNFNRNRMRDN